jgi:hypothetical protein
MARERQSRWEDLPVQVDDKTVTGRWTSGRGVVTVRYASGSKSTHSSEPDADETVARLMLWELLEEAQKHR